ncbi:hypothetical protein LJC57_04245 [Parabacteroides sp. OttesenSCG-928-G07]|nr:hypothetical protein [Parabacteroides sp. OttesenSCG-928-G21]MDL2277783.1 hypothetical protein [Parabacteroides sp. OttesenSCG-928-G07]
MKINKDLMDAIMMLAAIILVLITSSDFENMTIKYILMGGLTVVALVSIVFRVIGSKQNEHNSESFH